MVPVFAPVAGVRRLVLMAFGSMLALAGVLAFTIAPARAEPPKLIPYGLFGTHEDNAVGVAVEGSGAPVCVGFLRNELFGRSTVVKLDPSGKLLSPPSPFLGLRTTRVLR